MPDRETVKPYAEYTVRVPKLIDEFIGDLVTQYNQKITDPTKMVSKDVWYVWVIRDWYAQQMFPNVHKQADLVFIKNLTEAFEQCYSAK